MPVDGIGVAWGDPMPRIHSHAHNGRPHPGPSAAEGDPRFLLYAHDSWGLGHLRRNLTLATALTEAFPAASVLIVTGSPCATIFPCPDRVELIKLPSVTKDEDGAYVPRTLPGSIHFTLELRRRLLLETFEAFDPHLIIVDHQVLGLGGEALGMLRAAKRRGVRTILGMRDVVDSARSVSLEWSSADCWWALTDGYDKICIYGSPEVFDPCSEYELPDPMVERLEFTGYVVRPTPPASRRPLPATRPQALVTMGGGQDGGRFIDRYLDSLAVEPADWDSVIITGPLLDSREARRIKRRASLLPHTTVHRFHSDLPRLLEDSRAVVAMAGYNTCAEVLMSGTPTVYLPRTFPRQEQVIRATRLANLGLAQSLVDPTPAELRAAVARAIVQPGVDADVPSLDGCRRLCDVAGRLLSRERELAPPRDAQAFVS